MATKKTWQQRQAEHKKSAVLDILHRPAGESENKAITRVSAKYNGRTLPGRKQLKLSPSSLRRIWYAWKKNRSDSVFALNFSGAPGKSVAQPWVCFLFADYAVNHGLCIKQAYRELKAARPDLPFSLSIIQRHLSAADRARIAKALTLRKKLNDLELELETITEGGTR
jgi:hypothetical protein